jgi:hypothetical protein
MSKTKKVIGISILLSMLVIALAAIVVPSLVKIDRPDVLRASLSVQDDDVVLAKQEFALKHKSKFVNMTSDELIAQKQEFDKIVSNRDLVKVEKEDLLNKIGYYTFDDGQKPFESYSSPGNVTLSGVSIYYNASADQWTLSGSGRWNDVKYWDSGIPLISWPTKGSKYNVGDSEDAVGILLQDTYGEPNGVSVVGGGGSFTNGTDPVSTSNRWSNVSSSKGAVYRPRDRDYVYKVDTVLGIPTKAWYYYNASHFDVDVVYNGNFANYHGNAVFLYAHTWKSADLTSISFGIDGTIGVGWSNSNNRWDVISEIDRPF